MDYLGSALILAAVTCLLLALQWGGNDYAWGSECSFLPHHSLGHCDPNFRSEPPVENHTDFRLANHPPLCPRWPPRHCFRHMAMVPRRTCPHPHAHLQEPNRDCFCRSYVHAHVGNAGWYISATALLPGRECCDSSACLLDFALYCSHLRVYRIVSHTICTTDLQGPRSYPRTIRYRHHPIHVGSLCRYFYCGRYRSVYRSILAILGDWVS